MKQAPPDSDEESPPPAPAAAAKPERKTSKKPSVIAGAGKKKDADVDMSPPYSANDLKKTRFRDENKLKVRGSIEKSCPSVAKN